MMLCNLVIKLDAFLCARFNDWTKLVQRTIISMN